MENEPIKRLLKHYLGVILSLFLCSTGFTQSYLIHRYTEQNGLSSSEVQDVVQDRLGRMWFATRTGISFYDGLIWKTYDHTTGLPNPSFHRLAKDETGRIWAMTPIREGKIAVSYFDGHRWKTVSKLNVYIEAVEHTKQITFQVLQLPGRDFPTIAVGTPVDGLFIWDGAQWQQYGYKKGLESKKITGIVTVNRKFYVATNNGLYILSPGSGNNFEVSGRLNRQPGFPTNDISGIGLFDKNAFRDTPGANSQLWLFGHQWLGQLDLETQKLTLHKVPVSFKDKSRNIKLLPDYRNGLYIANVYEIFYYNFGSGAWETVDKNNGLISEGANSLFIDFEKNIWITCQRGVSKIASRRFSNYRKIHGLLEDEVTAVYEYKRDNFILGHDHGVTFFETPSSFHQKSRFQKLPFFTANSDHPLCRVLDIAEDSKGNIWLAAAWAGLARIDPNKRITWFRQDHGLPNNITCLWIGPGDDLWIGSTSGLYHREKGLFVRQQLANGAISSLRRIFGYDGKLRYLAENDLGFHIYNEKSKKWKHYEIPGGPNRNSVYAFEKDSQGRLIIGTRGGLFILKDPDDASVSAIVKLEHNGFVIDRPVFFILRDNDGKYWFGTDNGVIWWDGQNYGTYTTADGLTGHETNRAASIVDSRGRLWFGTNRGLSIYDPKFDNSVNFNPRPRVWLTHLEVAGKQLHLNHPIHLKYTENTLTFHFRGLSFLDENAIRFRNKLEGFEDQWSKEIYPYNQMIRYTNLSPGNYRFHLKARNNHGIWSAEITSPEIRIMKPYYRTWWFFMLAGMVMLAVIYSITRFFTQKRYASLLERRVEERSQQLQSVEKRYRNLFEESLDSIFISDPTGKFIDINPAAVRLFGYSSQEELLNIKSTRILFHNPTERRKYFDLIQQEGYVKDYELKLCRKNGEPIPVRVTATVVRDNEGKTVAYRGIIRDITQQKKLEQQLVQAQKMEAIGTLAGGIAHDFNNILGVMMGYTELAMDDLEENSNAYRHIQHVLTAAERASQLVKQILAFSRQSERKRSPLKLSNIIKEALKLLRSSLPATIEIRQDIEAESGMVMADATQMHQVMMNLCANAAHAMRDSGGILKIELRDIYIDSIAIAQHQNIEPGHYLRLIVSDTGHGIPEAVIKRIFEPYFTTKKAGEGTGMGLAVIHGIIKGHGGDISVYSKPGQGASFNILLPRVEGNETPKIKIREEILSGNENILLVDDEPELARVGAGMLKRLGYKVTTATTPAEALEIFKKDPSKVDLLITDLTMPQMTGLQLAREVRHTKPDLPVILCSGFSSSLTQDKIDAHRIDAFVTKPLIRSDLARAIRKTLDKSNGA